MICRKAMASNGTTLQNQKHDIHGNDAEALRGSRDRRSGVCSVGGVSS
jgi:hypothetical protein